MGYEGQKWLQITWFPGQRFIQLPSFPYLHICNLVGRTTFFLSPVCSPLFTPCALLVLSCRFFLALQHPAKQQCPWRERSPLQEQTPRCPITWDPELCTDTTQQQRQVFKRRSKTQSYRKAYGNSLARVRTLFLKGALKFNPFVTGRIKSSVL